MIVVYASKWAVSTSLLQEYDGVYWQVTFTSRTMNQTRSLWHGDERGVSLASYFGRVLYYAIIPGDQVLTRYSTLAGLVKIPRPQQETRKVGRAAIELDTGG